MTTENKHTPGPWFVEEIEGDCICIHSENPNTIMACQIVFDDIIDNESRANASLISAAPDLLDALEMALNFIANTESEMGETLQSGDAARAAIAKARGQ